MADIERLPCGVEHELRADAAIIRSWIDVANGPINREALADRIDRYANAAAELTAEIERLRAEVAEAREFRDKLAKAIGNEQLRMFIEKHGEPVPLTIRMQESEARAERLAEALREWWSAHRPVGWTEDQHRDRPYVNLITVADKALTEALLRDQEARND